MGGSGALSWVARVWSGMSMPWFTVSVGGVEALSWVAGAWSDLSMPWSQVSILGSGSVLVWKSGIFIAKNSPVRAEVV